MSQHLLLLSAHQDQVCFRLRVQAHAQARQDKAAYFHSLLSDADPRTVGQRVIAHYFPTQLGGRKGIDTSLALTVFRAAVDLATRASRSWVCLFVDIQAAYYEADRELLYRGRDLTSDLDGLGLPAQVHGLIRDGVLVGLAFPLNRSPCSKIALPAPTCVWLARPRLLWRLEDLVQVMVSPMSCLGLCLR